MHYIKFNDHWILKRKKEKNLFGFFLKLFGPVKERINENNPEIWYLEVNEKGEICREIALDKEGNILEIAPFNKNRGLWSDSNVVLNPSEYERISRSIFLENGNNGHLN